MEKHTAVYKIRLFETDADGRLKISALCSLFEEAADAHAYILNYGVSKLLSEGLTWVLVRFYLELEGSLPAFGESVAVTTWPIGVNRLFFRRDYTAESGGRIFARATSDWTMLNINTRQSISIPTKVMEELTFDGAEEALTPPNWKISPVKEGEDAGLFTVRRADIDRNNHVNNVKYIDWALEDISLNPLKNLTVIYRSEALYKDSVRLKKIDTEDGVLYSMYKEFEKELARVKISY